MGASDGAEICELVGLFLLDAIRKEFLELKIGLHLDDSLAVYGQLPGPKLKKNPKEYT